MRFNYFLSAFLATLTIASPISAGVDVAEGANLVTRGETVVETPEYKAAIIRLPEAVQNGFYYFIQKDMLGAKILDGDAETLSELEQQQKILGFEHIGVVVGQIKFTKVENKKTGDSTVTKDFVATYYHMTKNVRGEALVHAPNWKAGLVDFTKSSLQFGGDTKARGLEKARTAHKEYLLDPAHKMYNIQKNNCNTYAQTILYAFR
ncbi:uncharacterized protein GGS22DRAFT_152371 [Annulohypoxylon maeteangense]|uniref:uncharacterized protein n=1 Tax=Annulohypoxylon maeteangense TaxID=1927788 RepID=UPI0020079DF2|nr:uncharacterized protein GGS22DRAFT_152371 [Annulohypoxylon maeteangense]KAI0888799.1 hypothetical protein GGS22DRAFT_152371 [Annulohypoxylon maeteangense]